MKTLSAVAIAAALLLSGCNSNDTDAAPPSPTPPNPEPPTPIPPPTPTDPPGNTTPCLTCDGSHTLELQGCQTIRLVLEMDNEAVDAYLPPEYPRDTSPTSVMNADISVCEAAVLDNATVIQPFTAALTSLPVLPTHVDYEGFGTYVAEWLVSDARAADFLVARGYPAANATFAWSTAGPTRAVTVTSPLATFTVNAATAPSDSTRSEPVTLFHVRDGIAHRANETREAGVTSAPTAFVADAQKGAVRDLALGVESYRTGGVGHGVLTSFTQFQDP